MIIDELNEDGTVAKRLGDLFKENHGLNIEDEDEFRHIVTDNLPPQPNAYQQIRQVNMGKLLQIMMNKQKWKLDQTVVRYDK